MSSPFGPFGYEDIPWWDVQGVGGGIGKWAGSPSNEFGKILGGIVPVMVLNRDTGVIQERALVEEVYWASIAVAGIPPGGTWIPIWDFEPEQPNALVEQIILKVASGILDLTAAKLAPPAALLARALDRAAQQARGGVSTLAVVRGVWTNLASRNLFMMTSGSKLGVGNAGGNRIGWPIFAPSSFGEGVGEVAGNAVLSMGTNQVSNVLPNPMVWDISTAGAVAYGGLYAGQDQGAARGSTQMSDTLNNTLFPLVLTPGRVLHFTVLNLPTLGVPFSGSTWPQNGCVSIWWSEFTIDG